MSNQLKVFHLLRHTDVHGKSGTGIVALGGIWPNGQVSMQWLTYYSSMCVYPSIDDVLHIHGHEGRTEIVMGQPPADKPKRNKRKSNE